MGDDLPVRCHLAFEALTPIQVAALLQAYVGLVGLPVPAAAALFQAYEANVGLPVPAAAAPA